MIIDREIHLKLRGLGRTLVEHNGEMIPATVAYLEDMLRQKPTDIHEADILHEIAGEYARFEMKELELAALQRIAAIPTDEVSRLIGLADAMSFHKEMIPDANRLIEKAISSAKERGQYVRWALGEQARIARRSNDPALFEQSLRSLLLTTNLGEFRRWGFSRML